MNKQCLLIKNISGISNFYVCIVHTIIRTNAEAYKVFVSWTEALQERRYFVCANIDYLSSETYDKVEQKSYPVSYTHLLQREGKDTAYHFGGFLIYQPMFPLFIPQVAVNHGACQVLTAHAF